MPQAVVAVAGSFVGGTLAASAGGFWATALGTALAKAGASMVLASIFAPDVDQPKVEARGLQFNTNNPVAPIPVVYGRMKVGGNRVFAHAQGAKNENLYLVISLCEGEIEGYPTDQGTDLYINDKPLSEIETPKVFAVDFTGHKAIYGIKIPNMYQIGPSKTPVSVLDFYNHIIGDANYASKNWTVSIAGDVLTFTTKDATNWGMHSPQVYRKDLVYVDDEHSIRRILENWTTAIAGQPNLYYPYREPVRTVQVTSSGPVPYDEFYISLHTGSHAQKADSTFVTDVTEWTSAHRLKGVAYLAIKLKYNEKVFSNFPVITAVIDGQKVYDPRTSTTAWSDNPALCIRDYLTNTRYGAGASTSLIDDTAFNAAANYCDQMVCSLGTSYSNQSSCETAGGVWEKRYTMNGVVDVNRKPIENLKEMVTSCRGFLVFTGGKWKLLIDKDETAPADFEFNEDNITGAWSIDLGGKSTMLNRIRAEFPNAALGYSADLAVIDSTAYRTADNGVVLERSMQLPYTTSYSEAQRIATIDMNQSRQSISCSFNATTKGLRAEVGDVVPVTHSTPGWSGKLFRVMKMDLLGNDEVAVTLREHDPNVYDYGSLDVQDAIPDTNLPSPYDTAEISGLGFIINSYYSSAIGTLSWDEPTGGMVKRYNIKIEPVDGSTWRTPTELAGQQIETENNYFGISGLEAGDYVVSVSAENMLGVTGSETSIEINIPPPPMPGKVSGLELDLGQDGQANGTEWSGRDCKIKWRPASYYMTQEIDEAQEGADTGSLDWYHKDYEVEVYNGSTLLRTEYVTDTWYIYSYEKNAEDAAKNSTTPYRELTFHVRARGKQNQVSATPAIL